MRKQINQVQEFHKTFGLMVNNTPFIPSIEIGRLRAELHKEECKEVEEELLAKTDDNIDKVAKELADLCYVVFGTVVSYGLQDKFEAVFDEIHRANMSKADENGRAIINGENGVLDISRPIGKVLKSKNYKPADVSHIFN